jgi:hypothetical protein
MTNCQCRQPPGGGGECGPNHVAMCEVRNGQCYTSCVPVPGSIFASESPKHVANWLLDIVSGGERRASLNFTSADLRILQTGEYYNEKTGRDVHFGLPIKLQQLLELHELEQGEEQGAAAW